MNEIIFLVEEAPEGGFIAKALGASIFTQADDINELHQSLREAVDCHFEPMDKPKIIRLHFVREEVIAA
ncbi:MAG: 2-oxoisovalerate dehydrogenase [Methylovulum miyakonense]|uniref:2-oxoisovalerate dehydrogenase n=1 Tax=Methylovulum miyakonense TaxID=645578 RepID=UPI003BB4B128